MRLLDRALDFFSKFSREPRALTSQAPAPHRSVHVGINDYPGSGSDLRGCVNDASDWETFFCSAGFSDRQLLTNAAATGDAMLRAFSWAVEGIKPGSLSVVTYSGHGCQVPDKQGDEDDKLDEALCPYDFTWQTASRLDDDVLAAIFSCVPDGAAIVFIADCCHSGTLERAFLGDSLPRVMLWPGPELDSRAVIRPSRMGKISGLLHKAEAVGAKNLVMVSACKPEEVAYDSSDERGRPCGAFTRAALAALRNSKGEMTYSGLVSEASRLIREPQHPQLGGPYWASSAKVFTVGGGA